MVSVIMPVFNAEKYLAEALQSVLNQTYKDIEVICVDDGSTDHTKDVLADFERKDKRIRIFTNQQHLGAGASRNKGMDKAQGKYVLFLDGDDIFEEELIEKAYRAMEEFQTDIVMFETQHVPSDEIYIKRNRERSIDFVELYCKEPFSISSQNPETFPGWSNSVWDKLFLKSFLEENKLEFQNLPSSNDVYFSKIAVLCADKMIWLDDRRIMVYARDHSEPSRISNDRDPMCAYYAMQKLLRELKERDMLEKFADFFYYIFVSNMMYVLEREKNAERRHNFYDFLHNEGVAECIKESWEYYGKIGKYDRFILDNFQDNTYENGWLDDPCLYFRFYLRENGDSICQFIREAQQKNAVVILWGMGKNGTMLLRYLENHSVRIAAAVDADERKQGTVVSGYEIQKPEDIYAKADFIITTSKGLYQKVRETVQNSAVSLINIYDLLLGGGR